MIKTIFEIIIIRKIIHLECYTLFMRNMYHSAIYNSVRCSHFAQCLMNCYTGILNGFDLESINYDQIYYNLTIGSKKSQNSLK